MRRIIFSLVAIVTLAAAAPAEELSWQDVIVQMKQYNPTLQRASDTVTQAKQSYDRTYTNYLPQISLNGASGQSNSDAAGYAKSNSLGINGNLSLFNGFSDVSNTQMRADELKIAQAGYDRTLSDVVYSVRSNFLDLLWAQESVKLSEDILNQRNDNLDMIQLRYDSGNEDKGSLMRVRADKVQAEYDLMKARLDLRAAQVALLKAIGRDDMAAITVRGDFSVNLSTAGTLDLNLVTQIPEYRIAQYTLDKSEHTITSAKSEFYPALSLGAGSSRVGPSWAFENNSWNVGLNLSYPIFPGGRNIYDVRIAMTGKAISEQALRETGHQLQSKLVADFNNFVAAAGNVSVRQTYLDASQLQSSITTTKYMNGLSSYQDWYTIENDFIASERSLLNSRRDASLAEAQWNNFLGK